MGTAVVYALACRETSVKTLVYGAGVIGTLYAAKLQDGYWRRFLASKMANYVFGRHARAASREMRELANDCRTLLEKSGVEAPALRRLYRAIDAYAA